MTKIVIEEMGQRKNISLDNFPVRIGTDLNSEIVVTGPVSYGIALIIDILDGQYFLQRVNEKIEININNKSLKGNYSLRNGDVLEVSDKKISFELRDKQLHLLVEVQNLSSHPTQFQEKNKVNRILNNKFYRNLAIAVGFLICYLLFYLFTSNAIELKVNPDQTKIEISGGGFPHFRIGGRYLLREGNYMVNLSAPGYYSASEKIITSEDDSQIFSFSLNKLPGQLVINTIPGADIVVTADDVELEMNSNKMYTVDAGQKQIKIHTERYFPVEQEIEIEGMEKKQSIELKLIPAWSVVSIDSVPQEAKVLVDGKPVGFTPSEVEILQGVHLITLEKKGFKVFEKEISVIADQSMNLDIISLTLLDSRLKVITEPEGATILVNSEHQGRSPLNLDLQPLVSHTIDISKPGYQPINEIVRLKTFEEMQSNNEKNYFELKKVLKPIYGKISLNGTREATVTLDGKVLGMIPVDLDLLSKQQTLVITKEGYVSQEHLVNPTPGYKQNITINLLTPQETVLAAIPREIRTSQGAEMRLIFPGNEFILGAPRMDQGRRTNESERLVKITRPFYVGTKEVTNKEFREFEPKHTSGAEVFRQLSNNLHPTVMVTWDQAAAYCNWLSKKDGLKPAYELKNGRLELIRPVSSGYRLLTEAEWEWVSRYNGGGGQQKYPWGESFPVKDGSGNYADESAEDFLSNTLSKYSDDYPMTAPTGKFQANSLGIFDLGGNIAEWVNDYYSVFPRNLKIIELDPLGPIEGSSRVIKGSSWRHSSISALRYSYRDYGTTSRLDVGFRIARNSDTIE